MIINHGTFRIYTPETPAAVEPPSRPQRQSFEDKSAFMDAILDYQEAMDMWRIAMLPHEKVKAQKNAGVVFARRESDGADWYDVNHKLDKGKTYALVLGGRVISVSQDATMFGVFDGMVLLETDENIRGGLQYDGTKFV